MLVVNEEKVRAKYFLGRNLQSSATNLFHEENMQIDTKAAFFNTAQGMASGLDQSVIRAFEQALQEMKEARELVIYAHQLVGSLSVMDEEEDDESD